jgi:hypothetical protein
MWLCQDKPLSLAERTMKKGRKHMEDPLVPPEDSAETIEIVEVEATAGPSGDPTQNQNTPQEDLSRTPNSAIPSTDQTTRNPLMPREDLSRTSRNPVMPSADHMTPNPVMPQTDATRDPIMPPEDPAKPRNPLMPPEDPAAPRNPLMPEEEV